MADEQDTFDVLVVDGVEGASVYVNNYRIAGPKPWGGGNVLRTWSTDATSVLRSLPQPPKLDHIHAHPERWPHLHWPEGLHGHLDPQEEDSSSPAIERVVERIQKGGTS